MIKHTKHPFNLMIKPSGSACNLSCEYCYYLEKADFYPQSNFRMDDETLERVTTAYLAASPAGEVTFNWQGGEPLLMGLDFFRRAISLQRHHIGQGQRIHNALQTNGTLVTDEWGEFLAENHFLVGVSIDGPAAIHDRYRVDRGGKPTHDRVVRGLQILQRHQVEVNALTTVNHANMDHPLDVYRHLRDLGMEHLQFIPIVERESRTTRKVTRWSTRPDGYGQFLCDIFDYWSLHDVGTVFVQLFETALCVWMGGPPSLCVFSKTCGQALVAEHNGDLYACDHFVYPEHRRGMITPETLADLIESPEQQAFGLAKAELSEDCRQCPVEFLCGGDCPKHRIRSGSDGVMISYLCPGYKQFFTHSADVFRAMAGEIRVGRPASNVMEILQLS